MIKLEHISKTFGDTGDGVHAVKDVSLEIGDGEIFGIIGFSGAGKSTLVRCINLLEQPTSGSITVNGQKLTWMEKQADGKSCMRTVSPQELRQARKKISMIFQGFNLLMQRTCLKNVCFPMELSGVPKAQAEKKLLRRLLGGSGDRTVLHYILGVCFFSARSKPRCGSGHAGMELCRRTVL